MSWRDSCILVCKGATASITDGISTFLANNNYRIRDNGSKIDEADCLIEAEANARALVDLLKKPVPKTVDVTLREGENEVVASLRLIPFPELRFYALGMTLCMIGVTAFVFAIGCEWAKAHDAFATIWCMWVFIASVLLTLYTYYRSFNLLNCGKFVDGVRTEIEKRTGNATYIRGGMPGVLDTVMPPMVLMAALTVVAWDPDTWVVFLGVSPLLALIAVLYLRTGRMMRFFVGFLAFTVGITFGIYSTMPFWCSILLNPLIKEQMGWYLRQDPLLPIAIREALPLSWQPHALVLPSSLLLPIIMAPLLVIAVGVGGLVMMTFGFSGPSAHDLVKNVDKLRSQLRRASDAISGEQRSFSFKFQSVVWVLWAPINVFGAYLGLSAFGGALLGGTWMFGSSSIDAAREGINVLVAFIVHSDPGASSVAWFSRIVLLVYGVPIVLLMGLVGMKTGRSLWRDATAVIEARRHVHDVPPEVLSSIKEISEWAHVKRPLVRVVRRRGVDASTMISLFPWGPAVLTVSSDSLRQLTRAELNGLLAHEIGHMKQWRSYRYQWLNLLSQWTFFGNGWLLGGFDWFAAEYEADAFALAWNQHKEGKEKGRVAVISLLEGLQEQEVILAVTSFGSEVNERLLARGASWLPPWLAREIAVYPQIGIWRKWRATTGVYYQLLLGDAILSYCHPELGQRIERLNRQ